MPDKNNSRTEKALQFCEKVFDELVSAVEPPYRNCVFGGLLSLVIGAYGILTESNYLSPTTYIIFFAVGLGIMGKVAQLKIVSTDQKTKKMIEDSAKEQIELCKQVRDNINRKDGL